MKPRPFDYIRPDTVEEALALLAEYGDDARILAGGQSLVPMLNLRIVEAQALIDISRIAALDVIRDLGEAIEIGAAVTQNKLLAWPQLAEKLPLVAAALPHVGHFQTRNKGTVCGSIAHADPSSELPLALAPTCTVKGGATLRKNDPLLQRAERLRAEAATLNQRSRALRELRQLQHDLEATTRKLAFALRPYGVIERERFVPPWIFITAYGSIDRAVSSIEALNIPQVEKERIFSGTALSILNNV